MFFLNIYAHQGLPKLTCKAVSDQAVFWPYPVEKGVHYLGILKEESI